MTPEDVLALAALPAPVALMRLVIETPGEPEARALLRDAIAGAEGDAELAGHLRRIAALWDDHPQAWPLLRATLGTVDHDLASAPPDDRIRGFAEAFDRAAAVSPEASVALYSLGDPALLATATAEVVARLSDWGLLGANRTALDLGCGIGRFVVALAPRMARVEGLDISAAMVAAARARCRDFTNVRIEETEGRDLIGITDAAVDLVLAADVFPYLVAVEGLAPRMMGEIARVLKPGGAVLILNYSYRGDLDADRAEVAALAVSAGLVVERLGTADLATWDAVSFLLRKHPKSWTAA